MAWIQHVPTSRKQLLEPEHLVGRGSGSSLRVPERYISANHALVRWSGERWEVKDLGSRNGTFVDGVRILAGEDRPIRKGARLSFGKLEQEWLLLDESPPTAMAVPTDGGDPLLLEGELIAVPSPADPQATIFRDFAGSWVLEQPDESSARITNLQLFEVAGRRYRFCSPQLTTKTSIADGSCDLEVRVLRLVFSVTRDEEHVQLQVTCGGRTFDLGARSPHYLLLTLARRRMADTAEGLPETSCGWIDQDELEHDPSMAGPQLNIDVFRIRKQFAALGIIDAAKIVERRPRTRQLRIGTGALAVVVL